VEEGENQMKSPARNVLGKRIAPGIWEDKDGNPHFSLPELLALFDLEDTPRNREIAAANIREVIRQKNPAAKIVERKSPSD
jgi:hypothetical protein